MNILREIRVGCPHCMEEFTTTFVEPDIRADTLREVFSNVVGAEISDAKYVSLAFPIEYLKSIQRYPVILQTSSDVKGDRSNVV